MKKVREQMRDITPEERESIDKYIKSISKPTGVNIFDFYDDEDKSCDNCKHHLRFMCKKWETCHNYSDWELEELDFVQPHKTIPCKIKVTDGEYISREAVIDIIEDVCPIYGNDYRYILREKVNELPSVAIPSAEPKTGHWTRISMDKYSEHAKYWYRCDRCGKDNLGDTDWCPNCGATMD